MKLNTRLPQVLAFFAIGLLLVCSSQAQTKIDGTAETFSGSVKNIRVESAEIDRQANKEGKRRLISSQNFNESGQVIETNSYDTKGGLQSRKEIIYDPEGKSIQFITHNAKGASEFKTIYYFENGHKSKDEAYNEKNVLTNKTEYIYDTDGKLKETLNYDDNSLKYKVTHKYDQNGKLVESQTAFKDGGIKKEIYSSDGKRQENSYFKAKDSPENRLIVRIEKDKKAEISYYKVDGSIGARWIYTYDDKGNVIDEEFSTQAIFRKWNYLYEYDQQGNWTKRTTSQLFLVAGKPTPILEEASYRTFSYYSEPYKAVPKNILNEDNIGGVLAGRAVARVEPEYPSAAKRASIRGAVIVEVTVTEIGDVLTAKVLSGPTELKDAAIEAAKKWKFKPTLLYGLPVKVIGTITFNFNL